MGRDLLPAVIAALMVLPVMWANLSAGVASADPLLLEMGKVFRFPAADALLRPLLTVVKTTPVASFIILLLLWVGRDTLPAVIVVLMVLPVTWANVCAGIAAIDPQLREMGKVSGFSPLRAFRRLWLPTVLPHFLSACRSALGLGGKAGVAAEVLTVPRRSIGRMLYESKLNLETADLFAWTVTVILCSLVIEKLLAAVLGLLTPRRGRKGGGK